VTHPQLLTLGCDEHACVWLYPPTYRRCWADVWFATQLLARQQAIGQDVVDQVSRAMDAALSGVVMTDLDSNLERLYERQRSIASEPTN
jgi:hypothetical protein